MKTKLKLIKDDDGNAKITGDGHVMFLNETTGGETAVDVEKLWNDRHDASEDAKAQRLKAKEAGEELETANKKLEAFGETTPDDIKKLREQADKPPGKKELTDEEIAARVEDRFGTVRAELESTIADQKGELEKLKGLYDDEVEAHDSSYATRRFKDAVASIENFDVDFTDDAIRLLRDEFKVERAEETLKPQMVSRDEQGNVKPGTEQGSILSPEERLSQVVKTLRPKWLKTPSQTPGIPGVVPGVADANQSTSAAFAALVGDD